MDFLFNTQNNITVFEVGLLLLLNSGVHLLKKPKLGADQPRVYPLLGVLS